MKVDIRYYSHGVGTFSRDRIQAELPTNGWIIDNCETAGTSYNSGIHIYGNTLKKIHSKLEKCPHYSCIYKMYNNIGLKAVNDYAPEYLYIISDKVLMQLIINTVYIEGNSENKYSAKVGYKVNKLYDITNSKFYIKAQVFGGINEVMSKEGFKITDEKIKEMIAESTEVQ